MWTREERYPEPDAALRAAADGWLDLIPPDRLRSLVESIPGPRSRLHAPESMAGADDLITQSWRVAGWLVGRQRLHFRSVRGSLHRLDPGFGPPAPGAHVPGSRRDEPRRHRRGRDR